MPDGFGGPLLRAMLGLPPDYGPSFFGGPLTGLFSGGVVYVDTTSTPTLVFGEGFGFADDGMTPDTVAELPIDILTGGDVTVLPAPDVIDQTYRVGVLWDGLYEHGIPVGVRWAVEPHPFFAFIPCADILIPAGDSDITHWTITDLREIYPGFGLGYNGTAPWYPDAKPVALFPFDPVTSTTLVDTISSSRHVAFAVGTGWYEYEFTVLFQTADTGSGLKLGLTFPSPFSAQTGATITIPISATTSVEGHVNASGDSVEGTGVGATGTNYLASIHGLYAGAAGTLHVQHARGGSVSANVTIKSAVGRLRRLQ